MSSDQDGAWTTIGLLYAIGISGMLVVSVAVPALGGIAAEFRPPSPATIGWIMSMPALAAALASLGVGWLVDRFGDRHVMVAGGILVAISNIGVISSRLIEPLLAWRIIGGLGYVCVVVAAVTMMTRLTRGRRRATALALWSTVIPASFIVASIYGVTIGKSFDWRAVFIGHAVIVLALVGAGWLVIPNRESAGAPAGRLAGIGAVFRTPWPFVLGLSFAAAAFLQTGFVAMLPRMLSDTIGASEATVHSFNAIAMLCNVLGAFSFGWLYTRGVACWKIGIVAVLLCTFAALMLIIAPTSLGVAIAMNCLLMLGLGVLVGMWALLPVVAPSITCMGATSGLITQVTVLGVLFGPPAAFAANAAGTHGLLIYVAIGAVGSLVAWPIWRRPNQTAMARAAH